MAEPQREAQPHPVSDEDEAEVDTVSTAFDGDIRVAIRSLLIANEFLMEEVDRLRSSLSVGYVRLRPYGRNLCPSVANPVHQAYMQ